MARNKEYTIGVNRLKELLEEFLKLLCTKIRGILFPLLEDGALFTGTISDPPENLYEPFDNALADMA